MKNVKENGNNGSKRVGRNDNYEYGRYVPNSPNSQIEIASIPRSYQHNQDNSYTERMERLYPVYIPDDSRQNGGTSNTSPESQPSDGINFNTENSRYQVVTPVSSSINIPENSRYQVVTPVSSSINIPENFKENQGESYIKVSDETGYERNTQFSNEGDQIFSEGSSPVYFPNNPEQNGGSRISYEDEQNSETISNKDKMFTVELPPVYIPDSSGKKGRWSYGRPMISSESENYRKPDTGGTRERYFPEGNFRIHNHDMSGQQNMEYNRYIQRHPDNRGKADRIILLESSTENSGESESENESNSNNEKIYPIQIYQSNEKSAKSRISSANEVGQYLPNSESEVSTQIEPNEKAEGRANANDAVASYYDFLINEGSYKFWAVFQVVTAILLIYSAFAAIYYAKYTFSQMDYPDYLDDGFFFKRSGDIYATTTSTAKPESFSFLGLSPQTFQRIMNAISSKKYS
ncbi:hypothetical protein L9F63_004999 [Diploptera punctata]|uniref:Uncharacterized protein n=1 Tax=Diploptera punctata TaxID=6984 RepID=A0AAD7ZEA9_DIPPU|nr:hypothetical protein L9F63_004999 [Diploptera punctata]